MICEVCVDSIVGAQNAIRGGADRLELCGDLTTGGVTPSPGLLGAVLAMSSIPVMVMIRPRSGDFCYDGDELAVMCRDIDAARVAGATGVVFGALQPDGRLDADAMQTLLQQATGVSVTFHRALDVCRDPVAACEQLVNWHVTRVLTSGQCTSADRGIPLLRALQQRFGAHLAIMPGGGVRAENVALILRETGVRQVHFSGSEMVPSRMMFQRPDVTMASGAGGEVAPARPYTSSSRVAAICAAARSAGDASPSPQ